MNPIRSSLRYPAVTLTLTLGLLLLGTQAILHMPRMEDPSVVIVQVPLSIFLDKSRQIV